MREAVHVLGLNAATQCDPKKVGNWSCTACNSSMYDLQDINVTENGGHMAFTAFDRSLPGPGKIRVVLRGSLSVRDWISDANFFIDKAYSELGCEGCGVERGFHDSYQDLRPGIEASVEALLAKHPNASISVTGHSLGGAMAAHTAISFQLVKGWKLDSVFYTFGQPRVGDRNFSKWFARHFPGWLRSVHWNDPVPHLPPINVFGLGYSHFPREIWWTKDSVEPAIVCEAHSGEDPDCSDSIVAALTFTDHWYYLGRRVCGCVPFG